MEGPIDDSAMLELLGKHLAGECSPEETAMVQAWMAAAPENARTYEALVGIWEQAPAPDVQAQAAEDAAWLRLQARMHGQAQAAQAVPGPDQDGATILQMPRPSSSRTWFLRIAAMLAVAVSISLVFYLNQSRKNPAAELLSLASGDEPLTDTLPDGTIVSLNAHSRLDYPAQFAGTERVVVLQGEGFFDVAHDAAHPFRIQAGVADVRVLGTSFNLSARGDQVRVAVQTGTVELAAHDSLVQQPKARLRLTAGMKGSYDGQRRSMQQEQGEVENDQYWHTGRLVFRDASIGRVVEQLNAVFADSIALGNPAIANCRLNTSFERPSIDAAVAVIAETFDLSVTRNGKIYLLDGEACK